MWSIHRGRRRNYWLPCTSVLSSSPSPFNLLDCVSLRKTNLEVSGHHVRPQAGEGRTWQQGKMPHPPLSSLPPSTRPRFGFLEAMASTTFFATFPSWPGYCSLLSSPAAPALVMPARSPRWHETSSDLCDFLLRIPGLGQHHASSRTY